MTHNMVQQQNRIPQSVGEEISNSVSHGLGTLLSVAALVLLVVFGAVRGSVAAVLSGAFYGASLIILYAASTLYHSITNVKAKRVLRVFDHCSIFLLISGTYAPLSVLIIGGRIGLWLLVVNTLCAVIGVTLNAINLYKWKTVSMVLYIIMGWMCVFTAKPLYNATPHNLLWLLVGGGLCYTAGIVFYAAKKPRYMHFVWHLFVLAGSILHFLFILLTCYL